jgi:Flp pilus assembly protein TadD
MYNKKSQVKSTLFQKIALMVIGLLLSFVLLELGLRLGGGVFLSLQEYRNAASLQQKGTYRILCLGESTTALGGKDSYPSQLGEILNARKKGITFSIINKGVPGIDTSYIVAQLENNLKKYNPDLVITMMGVNDFGQYQSYKNQIFCDNLLWLRSLRLYKLARLFYLHIAANKKNIHRKGIKANGAEGMSLSLSQTSQTYYDEEPPAYVEEALKKNIELNPKDANAYMELGLFYLKQGRLVLELFKKAVELKTSNDHAYIALGLWQVPENQDSNTDKGLAEEVLKKAIELDPRNDKAYFGLGLLYSNQAKISSAITSFKKAIEINPKNDRAYGALAALYDEMGDFHSSERNYRKANELRSQYYNLATVNNFRELKNILDKRGVRLVCVQYPLRSIKPLLKALEGREGVIFVDNEKVFRKAIKERGYGRYFFDIFGGDFGHCNREGNRLLAENIANVILKDIFHK